MEQGAGPSVKALFRAALSFLNIVERGDELRLSPTRIGLWAVIFCMVWIVVKAPASSSGVFSAVATATAAAMGQLGLILNYIHQRKQDGEKREASLSTDL